ncbi:lytic transglycosylase [Sulfitobacter sp. PS-8MA]|uniref:lytic transglycosylase n=1 Tax=Sulfitobacter sp. PS-8MA TaxID=3237707 RepID=UPI0034C66484
MQRSVFGEILPSFAFKALRLAKFGAGQSYGGMKPLLLALALTVGPTFAAAELSQSPAAFVDVVATAQPQPRPKAREAVQEAALTFPEEVAPKETPQVLETAPFTSNLRPPARSSTLPRTRWQHVRGHSLWTRAALSALKSHGKPLVDMVPADVAEWCPAYPTASDPQRRAFWVGFMSTLAKHESTYRSWAVGGGGRWYGLLQILPGTARGYKCNVGSGDGLKNGAANLSCAVRIMATTVPRDGVIAGNGKRGVGADWGPMRSASKRKDMSSWLRRQSYCRPLDETRPRARP